MNNYRNYGNNGMRKSSGNMGECGCNGNNSMRMMQERTYGKQEKDCGCVRTETDRDKDCGCMKKEEKKETECGCKKKEEMAEKDCGCMIESMYRDAKKDSACCEEDMPGKVLAMAYVPWQTWRKLYDVCEGFSTGTIFKELDLEFLGRRCN